MSPVVNILLHKFIEPASITKSYEHFIMKIRLKQTIICFANLMKFGYFIMEPNCRPQPSIA
jgi:hypothetical protein